MVCSGGMDENDCMMPDFCFSSKGPMGKDGVECPVSCPMKCGPEDVWCPEQEDGNGCMMPEMCMPQGSECPSKAM